MWATNTAVSMAEATDVNTEMEHPVTIAATAEDTEINTNKKIKAIGVSQLRVVNLGGGSSPRGRGRKRKRDVDIQKIKDKEDKNAESVANEMGMDGIMAIKESSMGSAKKKEDDEGRGNKSKYAPDEDVNT